MQQPLGVDISTGVMDSDPPNSKCFPRSGLCGFQQPSLLIPVPLGTGRGEEKEGKHEHTFKNQLTFQGGKSLRGGFPYSSPPLSPRCGEGACCGVGVRQSCCCADPSISARSAFGEIQLISTPSLGFSREHNLPVSQSFSLFSQCSFERIEAFSEKSEGITGLA